MSLMDAARDVARNRPPRKCEVGKLMDRLDPQQREELQSLLDDHEFTAPVIIEALAREGLISPDRPVNRQTVLRHRNGVCCGGSR